MKRDVRVAATMRYFDNLTSPVSPEGTMRSGGNDPRNIATGVADKVDNMLLTKPL